MPNSALSLTEHFKQMYSYSYSQCISIISIHHALARHFSNTNTQFKGQ